MISPRWLIGSVVAGVLACTSGAAPEAAPGKVLHADDFSGDLSKWVVEQQPGGTVTIEDGRLVIADAKGCTVWFRTEVTAPVLIRYTVKASSAGRVSDINCFWMAGDPKSPGKLFAPGHGRTGEFGTYDPLATYYVGFGGNKNTTTRFRRYTGTGERPLLPAHDLRQSIEPDRTYRIQLVAAAGRAQFHRDGERVFDFKDPEPLTRGWFGFRTVNSRLEIDDFEVRSLSKDEAEALLKNE